MFILVSQSHLTMLVAYTRQPITSHHVGVGPDEAGIVHGHQVVDADVDHARPAVLVPQSRRRTGLHHGYSRPRHRGHLEGQPQKTQKTHTPTSKPPVYTITYFYCWPSILILRSFIIFLPIFYSISIGFPQTCTTVRTVPFPCLFG